VPWLGITLGKFHDRRRRYGKVNEHNVLVSWFSVNWRMPLGMILAPREVRVPLLCLRKWLSERMLAVAGIEKRNPYSDHPWLIRPALWASIFDRGKTHRALEDAARIVGRYVEHYNHVRLHSAVGYIAPADKLAGREAEIFAARDRKPAEARERGKEQREAARSRTVA
jgi:hypothetical protein